MEDDLWLESNSGKQGCAQTGPQNTKNIETERGNSRLPLKHGKPSISHLNRQASSSSVTAPKSQNGHDVSNDEKSVVLLHKHAKKQLPILDCLPMHKICKRLMAQQPTKSFQRPGSQAHP